MHADFYDLPYNTRYKTSADSANKSKILEKEVAINDCEQSLQIISLILSSEGTDTQCINQKAHLMPEQNQLSLLGRWVGGGDSQLRRCDYQIEHQPSHSGGLFEREMRPM
jgi:hypothetical protein